jgi:hypothetical protein
MTMVRLFLALVAVSGVTALWVSQCSGPRPVIDGAPVVRPPEQDGQPYRVDATIRNAGPGHGEVQVTVSLRDRASGQTYERVDHAQLEAGDQTHVAVEIAAPLADYEPQVHVEYPPG